MSNAPHLSECVRIRGRFLRSVNLEKDFAAATQNGEYIITPTARQVLKRLSDGLVENSPHRALTLTGPYGVGKSAFAVFLTRLLACPSGHGLSARRQLEEIDPATAKGLFSLSVFKKSRKGFLPILITSRRVPTSTCFLQSLHAAVSKIGAKQFRLVAKDLQRLMRGAERKSFTDSTLVLDALTLVARTAKADGYSGLLILIDELGKLFEFAARCPQQADVFVLQQLAEQASRSNDFPVLLLGLLHQSFEEYGQHLDMASRKEWAKIQGRFEDIAFLEPPEQLIRMIAAALQWKSGPPAPKLRKSVAELAKAAVRCGIVPVGLRHAEFEELAIAAYPLHPCALIALPYLFRRFAQNERSLFAYLSSLEPRGFQEFLTKHQLSVENPPFVRLEELSDYFTENFGLGLFRQPHAKRWLEAVDVLDRKDNLEPLHVRLVKTIGILNALGEFSPLCAKEDVINLATVDSASPTSQARAGLEFLKDQSILTYRKFNDTYRIWEGSDVDLEEKIAEGERRTRASLSLAAGILSHLKQRPFVARRHSFETGALRFFSVHYVDDLSEVPKPTPGAEDGDGRILVCLSASPSQAQSFQQAAKTPPFALENLLIAIPQFIGQVRSAVAELAALRWVWDNTPELRDDRAARRELALRVIDAETLLKTQLHRLLDPREEPVGSGCIWLHKGHKEAVRSPVEVSQLLSTVCDQIYAKGPRIRNELIVRRSLSSAAAAARRNLVEAMLTRISRPTLGIEGFPPERSIYESVLHATRLHRQNKAGEWYLAQPPEEHASNLWPSWKLLSELVFLSQPEPQRLDVVFRALASPPYGLVDGLHPVVLCAFMLVHKEEVTLYREGTFLPEPTTADFELIMRRPELFAIAGSRVAGGRADVVNRLAKGLDATPATVPVVRALFKMVRGFPEFAWRTKHVPESAQKIRSIFDNARSPERFLFVELPEALGLSAFSEAKASSSQIEAFFTALNQNLQVLSRATPQAIDKARDQLLQACGFEAGASHWQELREAAFRIEPHVTNPGVLTFLRRVTQSTDDSSTVASVIALVANCPVHTWTDLDAESFPALARAIGIPFQEAASAVERHSAHSVFTELSQDQRHQAQRLKSKLERFLTSSLKTTNTKVVRSALLALAQQLERGA
jgi:hypothetical protein